MINFTDVKSWIEGGVGAIALVAIKAYWPRVKTSILAASEAGMAKGIKVLVGMAENVPSAVPAERTDEFRALQKEVMSCYVRMAEILIPDTGMGTAKKAWVTEKLEALHIAKESFVVGGVDLIDEEVKLLNSAMKKEAESLTSSAPSDKINP